MPKLDLLPGEALPALAEEFEVAYTDERGEQRVPMTDAWSVPFEALHAGTRVPLVQGAAPLQRALVDGHDQHVGGYAL